MSKALSSILSRYTSKVLRPGENDETIKFPGPGVCILARETGPSEYAPLKVLYAKNDALAVAKSMLQHPRSDDSNLVVILLDVPPATALQVTEDLSKFVPPGD